MLINGLFNYPLDLGFITNSFLTFSYKYESTNKIQCRINQYDLSKPTCVHNFLRKFGRQGLVRGFTPKTPTIANPI